MCSRAIGDVLEIAVGAGAALAHYDPAVRLTGLDLSPAMVERATAVAAAMGRRPRLVVADAGDLPLDDASFDAVTCMFGLCCVPDVPTVLREAVRVLRPGGHLLLADHVPADLAVLRLVQRAVEVVSVPWHGEHLLRRPLLDVRALGLEVRETERGSAGLLELVHAVAP